VARILWRRRLLCSVVAAIVLVGGVGSLLVRHKTYQSKSSVALLPVSTNSGILPNYPNLIASLIPTYVQLVSSPVLLDQVAATLPFAISETQLANDVHAESLSSAAVINIVAQTRNAVQAQQIASRTTSVFLSELRGNGVVIPTIYAQPTVPSKPAPPSTKLMLVAIVAVAIVLGLGAGLIWDRLSGGVDGAQQSPEATPPEPTPPEATLPPVLGIIPNLAGQQDVSTILAARATSVPRSSWKSLRSNLMYATAAHQVRSVTITSLHPGEGKTTVAVNLAASVAELGLSVVLVDAAMSVPALHQVFGLENGRGLTSTVLDEADPASLLNAVPSIADLQVVTAGPQLSAHGEARLYLQQLSRFCSLGDLVIVDGAALQGDKAAGLTASATDAVVLVVPAAVSTPDQVKACLRILRKYDTPVVGTVLTAADRTLNGDQQSRDPDSSPVSEAISPPARS
jgi:Mrp family chromosome partitioning ATPase/capsular polysaccharide biosynthesis protein